MNGEWWKKGGSEIGHFGERDRQRNGKIFSKAGKKESALRVLNQRLHTLR